MGLEEQEQEHEQLCIKGSAFSYTSSYTSRKKPKATVGDVEKVGACGVMLQVTLMSFLCLSKNRVTSKITIDIVINHN